MTLHESKLATLNTQGDANAACSLVATGTGTLTLNSDTGTINIGTAGSARSINIGTPAFAQTISIGTGAAQQTIAIGNTSNTNSALSLNAGATGQITANARTNVKSAAGLYVTDASGNGIYFNQASGTTQQFGNVGTTTTVRMLPIVELGNSITCQTDKTPNIGTEAARINTVTSQTIANKTHDAFTGSQVFTQTGAVQTTDATVTTIFTYAVPDNCGAWMDIRVTGRDTGGSNRGMWVRNASVSRQAAGTANVDSTSTIGTDYNPGIWGGITVTTSGNNVIVRVTGKVGTTINWACAIRYQAVIANT